MLTIKVSSANSGTFLSCCITAILHAVNSFGSAIPTGPLGAIIILLSFASLLTGITSTRKHRFGINSILLLLTTTWMAVGFSLLWTSLKKSNSLTVPTNEEHLLPGYITTDIILLLFLILSIFDKRQRVISLLAAICIVLFTFEVISIWISWHVVGPVYITLALFLAFYWIINAIKGDNGPNRIGAHEEDTKISKESVNISNDYMVLFHAINAISFSSFGWQITTLATEVQLAFCWPLSSGIVLIVLGTSAFRNRDTVMGTMMTSFGCIWFCLGADLFLEDYQQKNYYLPIPICVLLITVLTIFSIFHFKQEVLRSLVVFMTILLVLSLTASGDSSYFAGSIGICGIIVSLYGMAAHFSHLVDFRFHLPVGADFLGNKFFKNSEFFKSKVSPFESSKSKLLWDIVLGYSKYVDIQCLTFFLNLVAASSLITIKSDYSIYALPFCVGFGGIMQFVVGFILFARGNTFESCSSLVYASFWSIWGPFHILDLLTNENVSTQSGCISFLFIAFLLSGLSLTVNVLWLFHSFVFSLVVSSFLVLGLTNYSRAAEIYNIVTLCLFGLTSLYGFILLYLKNIIGSDIVPIGKPVISISLLKSGIDEVVLADARKATGVQQVAEMMNRGKICGVPSDTVYILVAACNQPAAVERAYKSKKLAEDRPMSVWISNLNQVTEIKNEYSSILWEFLHEIWPSNVSVVLSRGKWVDVLGLGESGKYIGRPDSIAIRIPDCSIICHLIDQTGPIAVTSANPTGEADTTHHLQVLAKLGKEHCDAVLCDGPSPENAASTVVDCRNIDDGKLNFFRIGLTPKSKVEEVLHKVLTKHKMASDGSSDSGISNDCDKEDPSYEDIEEIRS